MDDPDTYFAAPHEIYRPSTVDNRYCGFQVFFEFLRVEEEGLKTPMRNMRPPQAPAHRPATALPLAQGASRSKR